MPDRPGIAAKIFGTVADHGMVVDMIVQNISRDGYTDISFTLPRTDRAKAVEVLAEVAHGIDAAGVTHDDRVAKVSIVGTGMRSHSGVAARMFQTLSREGINIQMISTSEIAVSCVVEDKYTELAVRALHDTFELAAERRWVPPALTRRQDLPWSSARARASPRLRGGASGGGPDPPKFASGPRPSGAPGRDLLR